MDEPSRHLWEWLICILLLLFIFRKMQLRFAYAAIMRNNRCEEPAKYPHKDPIFGVDLLWKYKKSFETGQFLDTVAQDFDKYGKTFEAKMFGTTIVKTIDSEVAKCTLATSFEKFGLEPLRYETARNLFGNGIVVVDGSKWAHARTLIQSSFDMAHIVNLASLSGHVDRLMTLIPRDGSTVDLLPLFKRLVCVMQIV